MDIPRQNSVKNKRRLKQFVWVGVAAVLILLVTVGFSRLKPAAPSATRSTVLIDTVKRGSIMRQVRGLGTLVPQQIRVIPAPAEGRVERILVQPGEEVSAGTVLVELVNPQLEQEATDIEFQIKAAESDYTSLRVRLQSDRMTQQSGEASVQAEYSQAKLQLDTDEALAKEGLVPELSLKLSRVRVQELANRMKIEQQRLTVNTEAIKAQLASQTARIEQLRALARLRRNQVASLRVLAGTTGVLQQVSVEVGQQVTPGANLARVADPTSLKAELRIAESQAKDIQMGQRATIDTHNGIVQGRVSRIDPGVQDNTVAVDVALEGALPQGVRPDLSVDGTIELERLNDVLYIARPAFAQTDSMTGMFKLEEGGASAVRTQVRLGRSSVNTVEVLEGLREGDQVILSDTSAWDNFQRIVLK